MAINGRKNAVNVFMDRRKISVSRHVGLLHIKGCITKKSTTDKNNINHKI
jgi:hypothetical protein